MPVTFFYQKVVVTFFGVPVINFQSCFGDVKKVAVTMVHKFDISAPVNLKGHFWSKMIFRPSD